MKCKNCNKSIGSNVKFCWNCGAEQEVKKKGLSAGAIVGIVFLSIFIFFVCLMMISVVISFGQNGVFSQDQTTPSSTTTIQQTPQQETPEQLAAKEQEYKEGCKTYSYKELARNPRNYIGETVKLTGEVIQVQEGYFNGVTLRVNITKNEYDFYEDTVYVEYTYPSSNSSKILEGDIITIYGEFKGEETYLAVLGNTVTIPSVEAKYITIEEVEE